jgi:hypothetical protein
MRVYGIVVEGEYDQAALTEIIKKCYVDEIEIIPRRCGGKKQLLKKFPGLLKSLRYQTQGAHFHKAFVICDADGEDSDKLEGRMRNKIANRNDLSETRFIVIVEELEAWLLADEEAISRVTRLQSGRTIARVSENLESIANPKEKLKELLSEARVYYTPEVARQIAKESELDKIEYRCPKFREFRQAVIDC